VRILIADDDVMSRRLIERPLASWGYEVRSTSDGDEAWGVLSEPDAPRIAIVDWEMPGADGPELCRRVRAQAQEPYIYVVLLTSRDTKADVIAGLDAGADDYLSKPFDLHELRVRLRAAERIVTLQTKLVAAREMLRFQATHDPLTGAPNRAAVDRALEREGSRAARDDRGLAVAMIDLDHFKRVNDTHGHAAGDAVLREVARRIASVLRAEDIVGGYGGEEFLMVLPGCETAAGAAAACERVRAAIAAQPVPFEGVWIDVAASIGVAVMSRGVDVARLVSACDAALYRAKNAGRNRVEIDALVADGPPTRRTERLSAPPAALC